MVVDKLTLNGKRDVWATRYMAPYSQELVSRLAFLTVFAVAVFGFGVPVYAGHSERLANEPRRSGGTIPFYGSGLRLIRRYGLAGIIPDETQSVIMDL